jgi:hypothetical protein
MGVKKKMKHDLGNSPRPTLGVARAWKHYIRMLVTALLVRQARLSAMLRDSTSG